MAKLTTTFTLVYEEEESELSSIDKTKSQYIIDDQKPGPSGLILNGYTSDPGKAFHVNFHLLPVKKSSTSLFNNRESTFLDEKYEFYQQVGVIPIDGFNKNWTKYQSIEVAQHRWRQFWKTIQDNCLKMGRIPSYKIPIFIPSKQSYIKQVLITDSKSSISVPITDRVYKKHVIIEAPVVEKFKNNKRKISYSNDVDTEVMPILFNKIRKYGKMGLRSSPKQVKKFVAKIKE